MKKSKHDFAFFDSSSEEEEPVLLKERSYSQPVKKKRPKPEIKLIELSSGDESDSIPRKRRLSQPRKSEPPQKKQKKEAAKAVQRSPTPPKPRVPVSPGLPVKRRSSTEDILADLERDDMFNDTWETEGVMAGGFSPVDYCVSLRDSPPLSQPRSQPRSQPSSQPKPRKRRKKVDKEQRERERREKKERKEREKKEKAEKRKREKEERDKKKKREKEEKKRNKVRDTCIGEFEKGKQPLRFIRVIFSKDLFSKKKRETVFTAGLVENKDNWRPKGCHQGPISYATARYAAPGLIRFQWRKLRSEITDKNDFMEDQGNLTDELLPNAFMLLDKDQILAYFKSGELQQVILTALAEEGLEKVTVILEEVRSLIDSKSSADVFKHENEIDAMMMDMNLSFSNKIRFKKTKSMQDSAQYLWYCTRAIAEERWRAKPTKLSLTQVKKMAGFNKKDKSHIFIQMLMQIKGLGESKARKIQATHGSLRKLYDKYSLLPTEKQRMALLEDLDYRLDGRGRTHRIGPVVSKKVYQAIYGFENGYDEL